MPVRVKSWFFFSQHAASGTKTFPLSVSCLAAFREVSSWAGPYKITRLYTKDDKNSKTLCGLCNNEIHVPYVLRIRTVSNADGLTNRTIRQLLLMVRNSAAALDMTGFFCLIIAINLHFHNGGMVWHTTFVCSLLFGLTVSFSNGPWQRKWQDDYWFFLFATIMALVVKWPLAKEMTRWLLILPFCHHYGSCCHPFLEEKIAIKFSDFYGTRRK